MRYSGALGRKGGSRRPLAPPTARAPGGGEHAARQPAGLAREDPARHRSVPPRQAAAVLDGAHPGAERTAASAPPTTRTAGRAARRRRLSSARAAASLPSPLRHASAGIRRELEGLVRAGLEFLERFRDREQGGYFWILEEDGRVKDDTKVVYGLSFMIYALAEFALLTGDEAAHREACALFDLLLARAADLCHGGFYEHFDREWRLADRAAGRHGAQVARRAHAPDGGLYHPVRAHRG